MDRLVLITFFVLTFSLFRIFGDPIPTIILPTIDVEITDEKKILLDINPSGLFILDLANDNVENPNLASNIKFDLEETLPNKIDSPDRQKPVDAIFIFGYGLNNNLLADLSLFIKNQNPKASISYLRRSMENYWIDKPNDKNSMSLDDLKSTILFNYKNFMLNADLGFYGKTYNLQDESIIYNALRKKAFNFDLTPSIKIDSTSSISLDFFNSFLINNCDGKDGIDVNRNEFSYLMDANINYSKIFGLKHFLSGYVGYSFNYQGDFTSGEYIDPKDPDGNVFKGKGANYFFNHIRAGANYSTIIKESFLIKGGFGFLGIFRDKEFFWYLMPYIRFGYSFKEYFHYYLEGGVSNIKKPDIYWYKENDFVTFPIDAVGGYKFYGKTGLKGFLLGWFSGYTDFEFSYNMSGFRWDIISKEENLYTLKSIDYFSLILHAGIRFTYKEIVEVKIEWQHNFWYFENMWQELPLNSRDSLKILSKFAIPKTGLSFTLDFIGEFYRKDLDDNIMNNIYLMNVGIDWSMQNSFGVGIKFDNILYFQKYQIMPNYDEPGFSFTVYVKLGF